VTRKQTQLFVAGNDIILPPELVTESNGILGKKGSGKTSAGVVLYEEMYAIGVPVVAIDPKGDWYGIRSSADGQSEGLPVPVFGGRHGDIPLEATGGKALAQLIRAEHMSCILDVSEFTTAERRRFLTAFVDALYRVDDRTPMHLILEEAHEYIPQRVDSGDAAMVGVFERIVKAGRFKGIGVTMMSQRSASLNKNVLTQIDNLFAMRTISPQDRAVVRAWLEGTVDSVHNRDEVTENLAKLQDGETFLVQPARGNPLRFRFRMRHTFDAGATPKVGQTRTEPTNIAKVNLSAIAAAMSETIEKAKLDDPAELRRQLADKIRENQRLTARVEQLESIVPVEVVEEVEIPVSVLTDHDRRNIQALREYLDRVLESWPVEQPKPSSAPPTPVARVSVPKPRPERAPAGEERARGVDGAQPDERIGKAERDILAVLATYGDRESQQVALLAGRSIKSSGYANALGKLRRLEFITRSQPMHITDTGLAALGDYQPLPTGHALIDHWMSNLGAAERDILSALIGVWPDSRPNEWLAEVTDRSIKSSGFANALGRLRSLKLITGGRDANRAVDELGEAF
jgi:hypothetical protein